MEFTPEIMWGAGEAPGLAAAHQRLTMHAARSLKINATGKNRVELTTW
jgi:hypothetical protein